MFVVGEFALQIVMACVVLLRKGNRPHVAMAWMVVVLAVPIGGAIAYLLVGETRFGAFRIRRHAKIISGFFNVLISLNIKKSKVFP